ncbi:hypothetical protein IJG89_03640 [Candidatus Saccharibacteria bacterium]|nr:hypothetical protein [Candidatus Saccharibacteria bacterium]
MAREINLVPDIKDEMLKALKLRNFIFFLCIVVAAASVGVTVFFGLIAGGQQLAIDSKKATIDTLSSKLNSYSDLNDFLTIKDQLGNLATLTSNKKVFSRTFDIILAFKPTSGDTITISELSVNLTDAQPSFTLSAQANAEKEPYIDYNVLDAFKKSMQYIHYDYGKYIDKNGNAIPAYCMIEADENGTLFNDPSKGIYAYWNINGEGCQPTDDTSYSTEEYSGEEVVRIWRTPQYEDWYKENPTEGQPYMSLEGAISNVPHFASSCITYSGDNSQSKSNPKWTENNNCKLVPDDANGIKITESSNGRLSEDDLVLRFSAKITLAPEVYNFNNTHMAIIPPSGHYNVTDSYVQVQAMFGKRAADCDKDDTACNSNTNTNTEEEE